MKGFFYSILAVFFALIIPCFSVLSNEPTNIVEITPTPSLEQIAPGAPSSYHVIYFATVKKKKTIKKGKKFRIKVQAYRNGSYVFRRKPFLTNKDIRKRMIRFSSSNRKIATVSKYGVVKAKKPGKVTIKVWQFRRKPKTKFYVTVKK